MHDAKGRELKVGDRVMVPCVVDQTSASEEYCNVMVKTIATMPPYTKSNGGLNTIVLNTKQTLRAEWTDDISFEVVEQVDGQVTLK